MRPKIKKHLVLGFQYFCEPRWYHNWKCCEFHLEFIFAENDSISRRKCWKTLGDEKIRRGNKCGESIPLCFALSIFLICSSVFCPLGMWFFVWLFVSFFTDSVSKNICRRTKYGCCPF